MNCTLFPVPLGIALKMMVAPADVAMKERRILPNAQGKIFMSVAPFFAMPSFPDTQYSRPNIKRPSGFRHRPHYFLDE